MQTIRTRISMAIALVVMVTVFLISVASNWLIKGRFEAYVTQQQKIRTENIAENLGLQFDLQTNKWNQDAVYALGMYALTDGFIIKVYDKNGLSVWDAENHDMASCQQVMEDIAARMREYGSAGSFASRTLALIQNGEQVGSLSISFYGPFFLSESDVIFLNALNLLLGLIGAGALLLSLVIGGLLARRISRPITKTVDIAKQIAQGHYDIHFEGQTRTSELHHLMSSLNYLAEALARQEAMRKQLTADVAHELRTPLATLGSHLEAMIEGVWQPTQERLTSCHEEIIRLGKLVRDLERLERAESADPALSRSPADMLELIRGVCSNFDAELLSKNLQLSLGGMPSLISVDRDAMSGVITNLLSNAVKYTPQGGQILITVEDTAGETLFKVEDNGPGIPEGELPYIFERLFRADKSRNRETGGAGIGLAIVKSIVSAHGGTVTAENRPGGGCRFEVRLPKVQ